MVLREEGKAAATIGEGTVYKLASWRKGLSCANTFPSGPREWEALRVRIGQINRSRVVFVGKMYEEGMWIGGVWKWVNVGLINSRKKGQGINEK